jgi:hypothetical protein
VSYRVTHYPRLDLFPYRTRCCQPAVPRFSRIGFILLCPQSSSKFLRYSFRLPLSEKPVLLGGFFPLRDITGSVHSRESTPSLATFRPQVFATSRRLTPPPVLWACCIPLPRPGLIPFRGFSRLAAVLTRRQACSSLLLPNRPLTVLGRLPRSAGSASRLYSTNRSVL